MHFLFLRLLQHGQGGRIVEVCACDARPSDAIGGAEHARLEEGVVVVAGRHDLRQDVVTVFLRLRAGGKQI